MNVSGNIESKHSINSFEWMGSRSHDLRADERMHSFAVDCETVSNEDKFAVVVQLASVEKHDLKQC